MTQFEIIMQTDTPELPAEIGNFAEVKAAIGEALKQYNTDTVVTADTVKDAEKVRATLRKAKEQIETYRKDAKSAYLDKFATLESQCKELSALIDEPITAIDTQIKSFEMAEQEKKWAELENAFVQIQNAYKLPGFIQLQDVVNPKWKNKGMTVAMLLTEIGNSAMVLKDDYTELQNLYGQSPLWTAINQRFMECKNQSQTLVYAAQLERQHSEEQKQADAIQREREIAQCPENDLQAHTAQEGNNAVIIPGSAEPAANRTETASQRIISGAFRVSGTVEQIKALAEYMKQTGITYEVIKN